MEALGRLALAIRTDVSKYAEKKNMPYSLPAQPARMDILVNNAGIGDVKQFTDITEADWDRILSVNLKKDIATACLHQSSEDASYVTGQVLSPNEGYFSYSSFFCHVKWALLLVIHAPVRSLS